ncbi:Alcohol dehydrogenase 4, mitochondrial [Sphaceloma murrayae]|uniref:Alcohol dehydrogenase 4, mitochondrial n=1 Tax=Sphaceloma murrayae TaxID=2082308 RepID=A0A2K1QM18_9PEZI|nr:Alcohol dehydrogenase 4, mitochondrial [Sphaceloma murrayae]
MSTPTYDIPKTCKAGVMHNEGPSFTLSIEDVPVPTPGPNDLLLRLNTTGLCYSDIHTMEAELVTPPMSTFGVVVAMGANVTGWKAARYATRIPDGVSDVVAGPIMCSATTVYRSLVGSELRAGDIACFPGGGGGVGIQGVQLAEAMGFRPIVVDSGAGKRKLAMECGAEAFVNFKEVKDVAAAVVEAADGVGVHGVFLGAKIMCIGLPNKGTVTIGADPTLFVFKNLTVKGTLVGSMRDTAVALDFAKRGLLKQICEMVPLKDLPEAVQRLRRGEVVGRIVVEFNA